MEPMTQGAPSPGRWYPHSRSIIEIASFVFYCRWGTAEIPARRLPWGAWRPGARDAVPFGLPVPYIEDLARRRRAGGASRSAGTSSGSATAWAALRDRRVWATPLAVAASVA